MTCYWGSDTWVTIYTCVTFNGLSDITSYFLTFYLIESWIGSRKTSIIVFSIVSGLCSMLVLRSCQ